ncbi:DUF3281 family protein [Francisellaceae bacterium CB300]
MNKHISRLIPSILLTALIAGCSESERVTEPRISSQCNGTICSFTIQNNDLVRYTNIIGKDIERTLHSTRLNAAEGTHITWTIGDENEGQYANSSKLILLGLEPCKDDICNSNSYPTTGFVFNTQKSHSIAVRGDIINQDGSKTTINEVSNVSLTIGEPKIIIKNIDGEKYTFSADVEHLGIQESNYDLSWSVDDEDNLSNNQATEFTYDFSTIINNKETHQDQHIVKLKVTPSDPSIDPIIVEQPILLQELSSPEMMISPIKGKSIVVSANADKLPNDTLYLWSVEGQPSLKGSGLSTTLNFPQYATAYTVTLTAKLPISGEILTTTKTITTGYGLPSIKTEIGGGSGNDYILSVDKTGTGLPDNTTYLWAIGDNYTIIGDTTNFEFVANTTTTVNLKVTVGNEIIGTVSKQVTSGNKSDPVILSVTKGYSPLY